MSCDVMCDVSRCDVMRCDVIRISPKISWNAAPATKSDARTSPNETDSPTSLQLHQVVKAPARERDAPRSPNSCTCREKRRSNTKYCIVVRLPFTELFLCWTILYWTDPVLNYYFTELFLFWTFPLLLYSFTDLFLYILICSFTELLLYCACFKIAVTRKFRN